MFIQVRPDGEIIQLVTIGGMEDPDRGFIRLTEENTPEEFLHTPFKFKYINGQLVKKEHADDGEIAALRKAKIEKFHDTCKKIIENGIDFNGEHYSLTQEDQINLTNLASMATTGIPGVPYHPDGGLCRIYPAEEITQLAQIAIAWITFHTTYFNHLKAEINATKSIDELLAIHYGSQLSQEHQEHLAELLGMNYDPRMLVEIPDEDDYSELLGIHDIPAMYLHYDGGGNEDEAIPIIDESDSESPVPKDSITEDSSLDNT